MIAWSFGVCIIFNVLNAIHDAARIKKNKKIYHWANALLYCLVILVCCIMFRATVYVPAMFALRPIVFDNTLNLFRGLKLTYTSANPESKVDKIEHGLFGGHEWGITNFFYCVIIIANLIVVKLVT